MAQESRDIHYGTELRSVDPHVSQVRTNVQFPEICQMGPNVDKIEENLENVPKSSGHGGAPNCYETAPV